MSRAFHATNEKGTCHWCGRKLDKGVGPYGNGFFCSQTCGWQFALAMVGSGTMFKSCESGPQAHRTRYEYPKCPVCGEKVKLCGGYTGYCCMNKECAHYYSKLDLVETGRTEHVTPGGTHILTVTYGINHREPRPVH